MKLFFTFLFSISVLAACRSPINQASDNDIKNEVSLAFNGLVEASKNFDLDEYYLFFDQENFTALNANGTTVDNFHTFKSLYDPQFKTLQKYNSLDFDPIYIRVIDHNNALLLNEFDAEIVLKSGDTISTSGAGVQYWSKSSGKWKLVHISSAVK